MVLNEAAETCNRKIHPWIPEGLPELIGLSANKFCQRVEQINAVKAVQCIGTKAHATRCAADFPELFPNCSRVRVTRLIVVLASCAVSTVRSPERNQPRDIDSGTQRLIRAKHCTASRQLKSEIINRLRPENGCKRPRQSIVAGEATATCAGIDQSAGV